jgi:hypothetical protein
MALLCLSILSNGCAPAAPTTIPPSPVPATVTPIPTETPIPSPTAEVPVWEETIRMDAPFEYSMPDRLYHQEEIAGSGIVLDTDTSWQMDIQVDALTENVGEASTGIVLRGYTENAEMPALVLVYQYGKWSLGYSPDASASHFDFWLTFDNLTAPAQSFVLSLSGDGRSISLKNNQGFVFNRRLAHNMFPDVQGILLITQIGPRTKIVLSTLVVEQLRLPSDLTASLVSLETPYTVDFETAKAADPTGIFPFAFPRKFDIANLFNGRDTWIREATFSAWALDSRAHSGQSAINAIPAGNPYTKYVLPVSTAMLAPVFDVSGHQTVTLKMWINTTSNPRVKAVHNCDSSLNVYYKIDSGAWMPKTALCGEHQKESQGWQEISLDFDVSGKSKIQFAFYYGVQNVTAPDPTVYFLLDDLEISAK